MSIQNVQNTTYNFSADQSELAAELGGDVSAQIAATLMVSARESRDGAREARINEEQHLEAQQARQVEMMMKQAEHIRNAGLAEGVSMMVGGGLNMVGAGTGDKAFNAGAEIYQGYGKGVAGVEDAEAQRCAAAATQAGNQSSAAERRLDDIRTQTQEATELVRSVIDFLRDAGKTESATDQAGIYLRG